MRNEKKIYEEHFKQKPIHLMKLQGRLGNQMFQYAFLLGLQYRRPEHIYLYGNIYNPSEDKYRFELERIFDIPANNIASADLIKQIVEANLLHIRYIPEISKSYQSINLDWEYLTVYQGYWQSELYFEEIVVNIKKAFKFNSELLNEKTREIAGKIKKEQTISIHLRRTDYISPANQSTYGSICNVNYYLEAIKVIKERMQSHFYIYLFSDDPDWVKANISLENSIIVDCNQGRDSWQDLYLMSLCNHNIIANSSFSWWGAWLNDHEDKIVIAPYRWFGTKLAPHIHLKSWITIPPQGYSRNSLIESIEKDEIPMNSDGLLDGKMGVIVFLFHYARIQQDEFYANIADNLLDSVLANINIHTSIDYSSGLSGIGTAIEYLFRNGFISGDMDDVLSEVDEIFEKMVYQNEMDMSLEYGLCGWMRYLRFRLIDRNDGNMGNHFSRNEQSLSNLLDFLENKKEISKVYQDDLIIELCELKKYDLYPTRINSILNHYLRDEADIRSTSLNHIECFQQERWENIQFQNTPVLKGWAWRELMTLKPQSPISWIELFRGLSIYL